MTDNLRDRIAEVVTRCHTNGLCPAAGPCADCDCHDPAHAQELAEADAVMALVQAELARAWDEGWDAATQTSVDDIGHLGANPYAAGEHDTPAGEPAADERHEYEMADTESIVMGHWRDGDSCVQCGHGPDHPVHQPATSSGNTEPAAGLLSAELARQERITRAIDGLAAGWMQAYDETVAERDRYKVAWRNARGRAWLARHPDAAAPPPEAQSGGATTAANAAGWEGTSVRPSSGQTAEHGIDTAAMRARHVQDPNDLGGRCARRDCDGPWPCAVIRLCDALDRQREETARLRELPCRRCPLTDHPVLDIAQQRDDARARLDEIDAVVPPCSDPNCGCVANRVRAILDRKEAPGGP